MTGHCMARDMDNCQQVVADTGFVVCPDPACERDWTRPTTADVLAGLERDYAAHADVVWAVRAVARVLEVVAAHEAATEGQPLGWAADIRNAIEGDQ